MNSYETLSEYYDRFTDDVGYEEWADFFERLFEKEGVKPELVLDLACGTGSLTRILAQRGYDMIGADDGVFCVWQAAVEDGLCAYQFDIFEQEDDVWHRAQETHEERIYEPAQLTAMLEQVGFTEIKTYGDQSFAPVQGGEDRIYFTARKRD